MPIPEALAKFKFPAVWLQSHLEWGFTVFSQPRLEYLTLKMRDSGTEGVSHTINHNKDNGEGYFLH